MPVFAREISSTTTRAKATDKEEYISDLKGLGKGVIMAAFKGDTTYTFLTEADAKAGKYTVTEYVTDRASGTKSPSGTTTVIGVQGVLNHQGLGLPGS